MPIKIKTKFGIIIDKLYKGRWSFGICLTHDEPETYLLINLFKWSISIGKLYDYKEDEEHVYGKEM